MMGIRNPFSLAVAPVCHSARTLQLCGRTHCIMRMLQEDPRSSDSPTGHNPRTSTRPQPPASSSVEPKQNPRTSTNVPGRAHRHFSGRRPLARKAGGVGGNGTGWCSAGMIQANHGLEMILQENDFEAFIGSPLDHRRTSSPQIIASALHILHWWP